MSSAMRRRRLNSSRTLTTASRLVFAFVNRMASFNSFSGISTVVFMLPLSGTLPYQPSLESRPRNLGFGWWHGVSGSSLVQTSCPHRVANQAAEHAACEHVRREM
jgi:hypothetical protein